MLPCLAPWIWFADDICVFPSHKGIIASPLSAHFSCFYIPALPLLVFIASDEDYCRVVETFGYHIQLLFFLYQLYLYILVFIASAEADPEKWKERWLKWRAKGVLWNFQLINYSLGHVSQSMCSCSCQCSTTIMKRMKQAMPFGFFALKDSLFTLSEW